jgi:hypothetical protein
LFSKVQLQQAVNNRFFFVCGKLEGKQMETDMQRMYAILKQKGNRTSIIKVMY